MPCVKKKNGLAAPDRFPPGVLLALEGAALGAALGGDIPAAAGHADVLRVAAVVAVVGTALYFAVDFRLHRGVLAHGVLAGAGAALLIGGAAGLAALLGGGAVHLNAHQAALVVLKMLAAVHLTFQTVHTRHLVFG